MARTVKASPARKVLEDSRKLRRLPIQRLTGVNLVEASQSQRATCLLARCLQPRLQERAPPKAKVESEAKERRSMAGRERPVAKGRALKKEGSPTTMSSSGTARLKPSARAARTQNTEGRTQHHRRRLAFRISQCRHPTSRLRRADQGQQDTRSRRRFRRLQHRFQVL